MKLFKKTMIIIISIVILLTIVTIIFVNQANFGKYPSGARLERIKKSPNFRDDKFQNQSFTPDISGDDNYITIMYNFFFQKHKDANPKNKIPSQNFDIKSISKTEDVFVWFGHSSYYLQVDGKRFLIDPVFSGAASPISSTTPSFEGTDIVTADDFDSIDYLFISHDHWDHLDYKTILKLKSKVGKIVTGLGTGEHLEYWGFDPKQIIEKDWYESEKLEEGFDITVLPARHFSGRGLMRNKALWVSLALKTPNFNLYLGGDSDYDKHFKEIGDKYGPFDLAFIECGQYNKNWKYIHMLPDEFSIVGEELKAKAVVPVHWSKFNLSLHAWYEPIEEFVKGAKGKSYNTITQMIGEKVSIKPEDLKNRPLNRWWDKVK